MLSQFDSPPMPLAEPNQTVSRLKNLHPVPEESPRLSSNNYDPAIKIYQIHKYVIHQQRGNRNKREF